MAAEPVPHARNLIIIAAAPHLQHRQGTLDRDEMRN